MKLLYKHIYHIVVKDISKLSHRQKQRAQKRLLKHQQLQENTKILLKKKGKSKEQVQEQVQLKNVCFFFFMINTLYYLNFDI